MQDLKIHRSESPSGHGLRLVEGAQTARPSVEALRVIETLNHHGPRAQCDPDAARIRYRESRKPLLGPLVEVDSCSKSEVRMPRR